MNSWPRERYFYQEALIWREEFPTASTRYVPHCMYELLLYLLLLESSVEPLWFERIISLQMSSSPAIVV